MEQTEIEKLARQYVKTLPAINYKSAYDFGMQNITAYTNGFNEAIKLQQASQSIYNEIDPVKQITDEEINDFAKEIGINPYEYPVFLTGFKKAIELTASSTVGKETKQ